MGCIDGSVYVYQAKPVLERPHKSGGQDHSTSAHRIEFLVRLNLNY